MQQYAKGAALISVCLVTLVCLLLMGTDREFNLQLCRSERSASARAAIIKEIRKALVPPKYGEYNLQKPNITYFSQLGQDRYIDSIMNKKRNGVFIEAGAYDGEALSNTLFLERHRGWTGLLVEPHPVLFKKLLKKGRRSWLLNGCLGTDPDRAQMLTLRYGSEHPAMSYIAGIGKVHRLLRGKDVTNIKNITCYPLGMIMEALGWSHVDYFSLDIEGAEASVLFSIPFNNVSFGIIDLECNSCLNKTGQTVATDETILQDRFFIKRLLAFYGYKEFHYMPPTDIFYKGHSA